MVSFTSSLLLKRMPTKYTFIVGNEWKSLEAKSGLYAGCWCRPERALCTDGLYFLWMTYDLRVFLNPFLSHSTPFFSLSLILSLSLSFLFSFSFMFPLPAPCSSFMFWGHFTAQHSLGNSTSFLSFPHLHILLTLFTSFTLSEDQSLPIPLAV